MSGSHHWSRCKVPKSDCAVRPPICDIAFEMLGLVKYSAYNCSREVAIWVLFYSVFSTRAVESWWRLDWYYMEVCCYCAHAKSRAEMLEFKMGQEMILIVCNWQFTTHHVASFQRTSPYENVFCEYSQTQRDSWLDATMPAFSKTDSQLGQFELIAKPEPQYCPKPGLYNISNRSKTLWSALNVSFMMKTTRYWCSTSSLKPSHHT